MRAAQRPDAAIYASAACSSNIAAGSTRLMTRSGTHRELSDRVDGPRLVRSTLSEMKGQAKPLPPHLARSPPGFAYSILREVLLNLKQGVETALARGGVPPVNQHPRS